MKNLRVVPFVCAALIGCFPSEPNNYKDPGPLFDLTVSSFTVTVTRGDSARVMALVQRRNGYTGPANVTVTSTSAAMNATIANTFTNQPTTTAVVLIATTATTPIGSYAATVEATADGVPTVHAVIGVNVVAPTGATSASTSHP